MRVMMERLRRAARTLRTVIGAPDYERYVAHVRSEHPGALVMTRREFERRRQDDREANPRARCC